MADKVANTGVEQDERMVSQYNYLEKESYCRIYCIGEIKIIFFCIFYNVITSSMVESLVD